MGKAQKTVYSGSIGNPYQASVKPDTRRKFHLKKKGKK